MNPARLAVAAALAVLALGPVLLADPPAPGSAAPTTRAPTSREGVLQRLRERGLALPSGSALPPLPSGLVVPSGSAPQPLPSAAALNLHRDLASKWQRLAESRHERRERHRAALVRELGQRLSDPDIKAELKLHATRVAELSRLKFLAENGRSGGERDKLLSRIDKLSTREAQRHRTRMAKLVGAVPAPSGSGATAAPPAAPSAGGKP